jgi:ABC-2 type transport system ATP-binding protein
LGHQISIKEEMKNSGSDSMVIDTRELSKIYNFGKASQEVVAIRSLNLQVPRNSIFGFIGPNGAGKTTTIKLLLGLVHPTGGSATILGYDSVRESIDIRKRIGYLPQDPRFYEYMTARETLRFKAHFFYVGPKTEIENRVQEMLEMVGLTDKADRPIKGFSGGERQRLGIAQAQINNPELLILDEPAAGLDPLGRRGVLEVMKRLREYTTIFYSTHILDDVQQVSDTVAIMHRGELLAQAPLNQLLAGKKHRVYLLTLAGNTHAAQVRIGTEEWVSDIRSTTDADQTRWEVEVTNADIAEDQLLRLVLEDKGLRVIEFGSKKYKLEDIFIDTIGNSQNG